MVVEEQEKTVGCYKNGSNEQSQKHCPIFRLPSVSARLCLVQKQEVSVIYMYMCYVIQIDVKVNHLHVCMYYQNVNLGHLVRQSYSSHTRKNTL